MPVAYTGTGLHLDSEQTNFVPNKRKLHMQDRSGYIILKHWAPHMPKYIQQKYLHIYQQLQMLLESAEQDME